MIEVERLRSEKLFNEIERLKRDKKETKESQKKLKKLQKEYYKLSEAYNEMDLIRKEQKKIIKRLINKEKSINLNSKRGLGTSKSDSNVGITKKRQRDCCTAAMTRKGHQRI